jgi:hypothetical protein
MVAIKKTAANSGIYVAPVRLSEQDLVDCSANNSANFALFGKKYNNYGCSGG